MEQIRKYGRGLARPAPMPAEQLRRCFAYDRENGVLTWRQCPQGGQGARRMRPGAIAGCKSTWGYIVVRLNKVLYPAHRIIWYMETGVWPPEQIDHINECKSDNRWVNLRLATHSQNQINQRPRRPNTSGYRGVVRFRDGWRAQIRISGKLKSFPTRRTAEEAYADYCAAAVQHHGEFARLI